MPETDGKRKDRSLRTLAFSLCAAALLPGLLLPAPAVARTPAAAPATGSFKSLDVFQLEYASDPRISPAGKQIVYVRNFMDIMKDQRRSNLWTLNVNGSQHRPLTTGNRNDSSPRWSPDGKRLLYLASVDGTRQIYVRWMDSGQTAKLTSVTTPPSDLAWSRDGKWIAFTMRVPERKKPLALMPEKPAGAKWAEPVRVIDKLIYRADGAGYLKDGYTQVFVLPADGGTPRQVTSGPYNHRGTPAWSRDDKTLIITANRHSDWEYDPLNTEIYAVSLADGRLTPLTHRQGPDHSPVVSRDGRKIAYLGFDDEQQGYQITRLYVMNHEGREKRLVSDQLDRDVNSPRWDEEGQGLYFQYDDEGETRIGYVSLDGQVETRAGRVGGTSLGRPYSSGSYTVSRSGRLAFTLTGADRPADVAAGGKRTARRLTHLNDDLLAHKSLGSLEEIWFESSYDHRRIQGWLLTPPGFDASRRYPLILEIHGGPFANYGPRFSAEMQLYAAAGYFVLYINPRGSTSYGGAFGNLIHHDYPDHDYEDLMSGVDAVIARDYIDDHNLFVTGGSGGGVLTSWIVGKTDRFQAAVVAKPVINWYSFVLTSDVYNYFYKYWFPGFPWDYPEHYMKRSPISLVGHVSTPTMVLSGEADHRTPISEAEQFYQALKLRRIETVMVRVPGASHGLTKRPSNLISKVVHILAWFDKHRHE